MAEKRMLNILENNAPKMIRTYGTRKWKHKKLLIWIRDFILLGRCHVTRGPRIVQAYRTLGFKFLATWPTRKTKQTMGEETGSYNADWMSRVADRIQRRAVVLVVLHIRTM